MELNQKSNADIMGFGEFVTLMALMMSLTALSIDAMLPALPQIGHDLEVLHVNDNQLIISILFLGFSLGQIIYGPLSDSFGRKPAVYIGFSLAIMGCLISIFATSFALMLTGRVLQGLGLASSRILTIAIIRDRYEGNEMARVMSFVMMVFIIVPTIAPAIGQAILLVADWQMIFVFILVLILITLFWFIVRQVETLSHNQRIAFSLPVIAANTMKILKTPTVLPCTIMAGLVFSSFLGYLSSSQQILQQQYQLGEMFPLYFAALALAIGTASFTNAKLVMNYGMLQMSLCALTLTALVSVLFFALFFTSEPPLWLLMTYLAIVLFCFGILMSNLNALAMQPLGNMAGLGASVVGALSTLISIPFGVLIGQSYNHSVLPLIGGFALFSILALIIMYKANLHAEKVKS